MIIKSNLKKAIPKEMRLSIKVADALNKKADQIMKKAAERAKANKRTTILPQDV
jgi:histone H3/H4